MFKCDNDVVDHQVTLIEFEGGITAAFMLHGFSVENTRTLRICGTHGEIKGHLSKNDIRVGRFLDEKEETITPAPQAGGHHGGDWVMMRGFAEAVRSGDRSKLLTDAETSLESHLIGYAAEESRLNHGRVVERPKRPATKSPGRPTVGAT